jgi:hypothetical protein
VSGWTLYTFSNTICRAAALLVIATATICLASCKSERTAAPVRPATDQAVSPAPASLSAGEGAYSLKIDPPVANRRTTLVVVAEGFPLQAGSISWKVNGTPETSAEADRFDCSGTRKGDRVLATAVVNGREVRSNEVVIGNTPPELSDVTLQSVTTTQGESFAVSAEASDADGDKVTIQYAWTVNDVPAGNGDTLMRAVKRNDSVRVMVSAYDGQTLGESIVLSRTIANHPPVFVEHQDFTQSGGSVLYRARALDADGDEVAFSLASPVAGMTIDRLSGNFVWKVPDGFRGEQTATIVADDGHLGTAQYTVTFTIRD